MEIFVEFTDWDVPAQQGFHLSKGLAPGAVCGHGKRQHDRQRRDQAAFSLLPRVLEQADGEVCRSVLKASSAALPEVFSGVMPFIRSSACTFAAQPVSLSSPVANNDRQRNIAIHCFSF